MLDVRGRSKSQVKWGGSRYLPELGRRCFEQICDGDRNTVFFWVPEKCRGSLGAWGAYSTPRRSLHGPDASTAQDDLRLQALWFCGSFQVARAGGVGCRGLPSAVSGSRFAWGQMGRVAPLVAAARSAVPTRAPLKLTCATMALWLLQLLFPCRPTPFMNS